MNRAVSAVLIALAVLPAGGCVKRSLLVKSEPPGATVFIDDREIGRTPVTTPFYHYGYREIRLEKDGFRTKSEIVQIKVPAYQVYPIDFFFDVLSPKTIYDRRRVSFVLEERKPVDEEKLLERAGDMREDMLERTGGGPAPE